MDRDRVRRRDRAVQRAAPAGQAEAAPRERITVEVGGKRLEVVLPAGLGAAAPAAAGPAAAAVRRPPGGRSTTRARPPGDELVSPMQGTIIKIVAAEGEHVSAGDTVVVLEAMKMEQPLTAHKDGTVTGLAVQVGQTVPAGGVICQLRTDRLDSMRPPLAARRSRWPGVPGDPAAG